MYSEWLVQVPYQSPIGDNPGSHPPVHTFGMKGSGRRCLFLYNYRVGEVSSKQEIQGFPFGVRRPSEGVTKVPSLLLVSLDRALCNIADLGRSLMELTVLQAHWKPPFYISAESLYTVPNFTDSYFFGTH